MINVVVTKKASDYILKLFGMRDRLPLGVKVWLKSEGCSGFVYAMDYIDESDNVSGLTAVQTEFGIVLFFNSCEKDMMDGLQVDYRDSILDPGFVFSNPNEKGRCSCGKSFGI
ncbi:HesB/IscA family protein [Candidatus Hydrogenosomobacter endosymbioticus]|uniref:Iron-sulfur cluster assembly protein IscA n=1 Tax=Candidatus Hydrogenosomobacter endosymbioticus TaxID=2558174 RepID=A0ABM7V9K8_9PROT|nr:iron-sulfur cluster assembly accessory protein [Candidatus Hydrogenosomobacter endosymbioticus]BDB96194.1 iron-sulfur cluster assembly protein IscA [Candidatus Hydrogenosomobacter endosymbioticus]